MKNKIVLLVILINLFSPKLQAQKGNTIAAAGAAAIISGILVANSIENVKEGFERHMLEWILENKNIQNSVEFELKLIKWEATKKEDLTAVSIVAFQYKEKDKDPIIYLNACSRGWINDNGVNFNYVKVYEINKEYWGKIMGSYLNLSRDDIEVSKYDLKNIESLNDKKKVVLQSLGKMSDINDNGIEFNDVIKGISHIDFRKLDTEKSYVFTDFDENFKLGFNQGNLNIFLKSTKDLVTIKRNFIVELNQILFN